MTSRSFLFLLGSARTGGNTEALARAAAERLPAGTAQRWLHLASLDLPEYTDARHAPGGPDAQVTTGDEALLLEATLGASDLVIASPLYWYSLSSATKRYLDHWSKWLRTPDPEFRAKMAGRTLWGVTAMAHAEQEVARPLELTLQHTAAYMGMRFGGVLLGTASRPGQVLADERALARAASFFAGEPELARFPYDR
ncbi:NAD(P)H-dependent oxidoreductase [Kitasatospora sp. NA04385]|uniref:flavodoxin family protein n=1 Tax=Kitasatospora sp. NA04385 TaxID=2742135 RepID=UPI0015912F9A|nr:NAD(P)H-dependent oxidoreductase [Kitasatospora sp. NA04385]QKW17965.1 NAD(P)H-dependent oxidoreductase [Kitasatospora sp. NA04385]